jgi:hypothetical protein
MFSIEPSELPDGLNHVGSARPLASRWDQMRRSSGYDDTGLLASVGRVEPRECCESRCLTGLWQPKHVHASCALHRLHKTRSWQQGRDSCH